MRGLVLAVGSVVFAEAVLDVLTESGDKVKWAFLDP